MKWRVASSVESATRAQRQIASAQRAASAQARQEANKRGQTMSVLSSEVRELRKMQKTSVAEVARLQSELSVSKDEVSNVMPYGNRDMSHMPHTLHTVQKMYV
jgi:hypothetical protein